MKELTIEEKAKRYNEALERARKLQENSKGMILKKWLWNIFPELKESRDNRIMKVIRGWIYTRPASFFDNGISKEEILAWLEKQGEQKPVDSYCQENCKGFQETGKCFADGDCKAKREAESNDKNEPKFHEGDWVVSGQFVTQIREIAGDGYVNSHNGFISFEGAKYYHLWTIQDAKDGDVLVFKNNIGGIIICKSPSDYDTRSYCRLIRDNLINKEESGWNSTLLVPATKEQRDTLFAKMKEAGYAFDFEKKELKKLGQPEVTKTSDQEEIAEIPFGAKDSELQEATYYIPKGFYAEIKGDIVLIKKGKQKPEWSEEDERNIQNIDSVLFYDKKLPEDTCVKLRNFLKTLRDRVGCEANCTTTKEWSEEDKKCIRLSTDIIDSALRAGFCVQLDRDRCVDWLKSLRPHKQWKPSGEQIKAFEHFVRSIGESGNASPYENNTKFLYSLLEQLKKL